MRPRRLIVVAGTGTEVGKTFIGAAVIGALRAQGHSVIARKPAQSFESGDTRTDAVVLGEATGEPAVAVCPELRWYPVPMAPPMAAEYFHHEPFTTAELAGELAWPEDATDVALVELAGGAWSPQASDGRHMGDYADAVGADGVLLVADAALGVINAVRGALAALGTSRPVVVYLNRFDDTDDLHQRNRAWLVDHDGLSVVTTPAEAANALAAI